MSQPGDYYEIPIVWHGKKCHRADAPCDQCAPPPASLPLSIPHRDGSRAAKAEAPPAPQPDDLQKLVGQKVTAVTRLGRIVTLLFPNNSLMMKLEVGDTPVAQPEPPVGCDGPFPETQAEIAEGRRHAKSVTMNAKCVTGPPARTLRPGSAQQWRLTHDLPPELLVECNFWTDYKAESFAAQFQTPGTSQQVPRESNICPRCEGTGNYQRLPNSQITKCAVCEGTGKIAPAAPSPAAPAPQTSALIYPLGSECKECGMALGTHLPTCSRNPKDDEPAPSPAGEPPVPCCYCGEGDSDHATCKKAAAHVRRETIRRLAAKCNPPFFSEERKWILEWLREQIGKEG